MPILQSRMIRLLEAGETFCERDRSLRDQLTMVCAAVGVGRMTPENAIAHLYSYLQVTPKYDPAELTLREERTKLSDTRIRNQTERVRQQLKREHARAGQPVARGTPFNRLFEPIPTETPAAPELDDNLTDADIATWDRNPLTPQQTTEAERIAEELHRRRQERGEE